MERFVVSVAAVAQLSIRINERFALETNFSTNARASHNCPL